MDLNLSLTITGVVLAAIAIIVSYHLAHRQGTFKKVSLDLYPTFQQFLPPNKKWLRLPWLFVNSCQLEEEKDNDLLFYLPIMIKNNSSVSAENVSLILQFDGAYSTEHLGNDLMYADFQKHTNYFKRFHYKDPGNLCNTIYEIPLLTAQNGVQFMEVLLFNPLFIKSKITNLEKSIFKDEKDFAILKINYQISAKNLDKTIYGHFWVLSTQDDNVENFLQTKKSKIDKLLELTDINWEKLHKRKYFVPWPYKFFGSLFYPNLGLKYNVNLKEICGYSLIEDTEKKRHVIEAIEISKISWGVLTVPFSVD